MKTFFLCSLGPVQDFIATARKSRDLWYGSWLLSELAKVIAKGLSDIYSLEKLIFPCPDDETLLKHDQAFNVPNKIMAELDNFNPADVDKIKAAMNEYLISIWDGARNEIKGDLETDKLAIQQIMDLIEFYWVAVPYERDKDYPKAREKAEALLAARKNTRDFDQHVGNNKPKSSLDGFRESVIPKNAYPSGKESEQAKETKIKALYRNYHAGEAEQLSGIDLLKRLGSSTSLVNFPSTSDLAASSFFDRINGDDKSKSKEKHIIQAIKKEILYPQGWKDAELTENRSLVFESRLAEFLPTKEERDKARSALSEILKPYVDDVRPNPYYALLIADGDNMGKLIDSLETPEKHRDLSKIISSFALAVPQIIKYSYEGACIYAGGEDILAYLPLQNTLACAMKLHEAFNSKVSGYSFTDDDGTTKYPTLSGGIVIAHHLTPLSEVFRLARKAEKEAKLVKDKNSLVIVLNKRSGTEKLVKGKWPEIVDRLEKMVELSRNKWISGGTAYEFQQLHQNLSGIGIPSEEDALSDEAMRIVKRKRQSGSDEKLTSNVLNQFETWLLHDKLSVYELAQEMIIAKEFAGSEEMAKKPIKEVLKWKNG